MPLRYKWNIVGHEPLLASIERDIANGSISHAYLFSGPPQVGKFTVARTLAHILQCARDFCHECITCTQISKNIHSETISLRDDGAALSIETMRDLLGRLYLTASGRYKVVMLERVERMAAEAANCLLKTLEEPPPQTVFLMTTDSIRELLPTVVSRSRVLSFRPCTNDALAAHLKNVYFAVEDETIAVACELSLGRAGIAFKLLEDPEVMDFYKSLYRDLSRFLEFPNVFERMAYVQNFVEDKEKISALLDIFTHIVRAKMLAQPQLYASFATLLEHIRFVKNGFTHHVNPRLALEDLMLSF